ncbi:probable isoaspartyl peptidase/L-asparaginase 2 isoform X1 [Triticum dicoccoides]|uniref:probable isoaspartyl peptidase/L-asparaginase 2 isoform X1 n=1 Tax=Triticum dicoccoides TaxID=85692 RepID=UPI00188F5990|nr:probable isoaspartyl peptidase/L-asparaginase 2 isoform X1 [Triticum dicoccoides]
MARWAIAIHGGAGVDPNLPVHRQEEAERVLARCLQVGVDMLRSGAAALDVVDAVVRELETDPCFNSGRGSALTRAGTVEMEASIMDGHGRRCGAVSGVSTVRNPVSLARRVMDKSPHSYLAFNGAEDFAREPGLIEFFSVDNSYFITEENVGMLKLAKESNSILFDYRIPLAEAAASESHTNGGMVMNGLPISIYAPETVGCAVVDSSGHTAAATSTGGLMNKMTGRIGDSPLIGAGTYACGHCAVSCTGEGEAIIRSTLARDVAAVMEYKGLPLQEAVDFCVKERLDEGFAGLIAVSGTGEVAYGFNCTGMFRGCATEDGFMEVGTWE